MQASAPLPAGLELVYEGELDDSFTGLAGEDGLMTVAGFGSLLSERSARYTFPELQNFRPGLVHGWRRVFAHTADVFFVRGIARPETVRPAPHEGGRTPIADYLARHPHIMDELPPPELAQRYNG
ncbi:hypothetical protein TSOC_007925 [Tetrabaena socialis]|uniref:Uncharacterized protein n=1 Tax=Tetrabaena socialis TaxID=47790 RepID=A0A2J7ZZT0_9CHLO|nr:hypothetical protein TSOC_007925 [Tetrabaena socialis]|eukprot:PNH05773.1 hypothetical protein TSOC_007925 [Tetrabaena socialis]